MTGFQSKKLAAKIQPKILDPIPNYKIIDQATVDGELWYTVKVLKPWIMEWVRSQPKSKQWEHPNDGRSGIRFDMHSKLFTVLALKWS